MQIIHNPCFTANLPPFPNSTIRLTTTTTTSSSTFLTSRASNFFSGNLRFSYPNSPFFRRRKPLPASSAVRASRTDYYSTLQVSRDATLQEIKASYRKLARQYHPDVSRSPGAEEKFKEISAAYEVLSDDEKRSVYDRFGEEGLQGVSDGSSGVDPFDVFDTFFGGSDGFFAGMGEEGGFNFNSRNKNNQGLDIRHDLHLSFEESVFGGRREIEITCLEACSSCDGTGAKTSNDLKSCSTCGGRGGVIKTQKTPFGMMSQVSTCGTCGGDGKIITDFCRICGGNGRVQSKRTMDLVIPAGVSDGATMQMRGEGNFDSKRGIAGNLYIVLHVDSKQGIKREGLNLYSTINLHYTEAILGTTLKVETVEGMKDLDIPSGTQPGETVKLSRLGVPDINKRSVRGDHYFVVNVLIPKKISDSERALLEELASFQKCSKGFSYPSESNGMTEERFAKDKVRGKENAHSKQETKRVPSLWGLIKGFMGNSREGFATVSMDTSALPWKSTMSGSPFLVSVFIAIIITYIFTLLGKTFFPKLLQRKYSHSHSHSRRTLK
ncbi:uncharacterized protein LOC133831733 isoform X2 [Humulus lupulus]|uniref:uncharacterized protein LOC133831733 isoform X2 n=1 Tax=Humulus lupulus TaxID=3486 RepID=UPI002B41846D|nr:uncharacterized protein LOC133831733 isoform X2 [Humulus lupulus]